MSGLGDRRIAVVREHMALEVTHDWDGVIATFAHPRYEMHGGGAVFDGEAAVRRYFAERLNFIELDWSRGDDWTQLCAFLGVPRPAIPFPHANRRTYVPLYDPHRDYQQ